MSKRSFKMIVFGIMCLLLSNCTNPNGYNSSKAFQFEEIPKGVEVDDFVEQSLIKLKKAHPSNIFNLVNFLYEKKHYDQAAYVFYIGNNAFELYNHANPKFHKLDKLQFDQVSFTYAFEIYEHLHSDLDNYSAIVEKARVWYLKNGGNYFKSEKEMKYHVVQLKELEKLAIQLRDDPDQYLKELEELKNSFSVN